MLQPPQANGRRANSRAGKLCVNRVRCSRSWKRKSPKRKWRDCMANETYTGTQEDRYAIVYLSTCLLIYFIIGIQYAALTPAWQVPDEPAHYNFIKHIAQTGSLPELKKGDYDQNYLARLTGEKFPPDLSVDSVRYESWQPPLYYILATPYLSHLQRRTPPAPSLFFANRRGRHCVCLSCGK